MIIVCPQCETSFAIPDEVYKPGRKARCSQCAHVFVMPDMNAQSVTASDTESSRPEPAPTRRSTTPVPDLEDLLPPSDNTSVASAGGEEGIKRRNIKKLIILALIVLVCLSGLGVGSYMIYGAYKAASVAKEDEMKMSRAQARSRAREDEARLRKNQDETVREITPENVEQIVVKNKQMGPLVVVQGYMRNNFKEPRDDIVVEVRLLDANGKVLAKSQQLCGISVTRVQLEELTEKELVQVLNNQVNMMVNNSDIKTGAQTPFCIVFPKVPEGFATYEVRPVAAKKSPPMAQGN